MIQASEEKRRCQSGPRRGSAATHVNELAALVALLRLSKVSAGMWTPERLW